MSDIRKSRMPVRTSNRIRERNWRKFLAGLEAYDKQTWERFKENEEYIPNVEEIKARVCARMDATQ